MSNISVEMILDVADQAARSTMRKGSRWWPEDWEDAKSEAIVGILDAMRDEPDAGRGYYYRAGVFSIYGWMRMWINGGRPCQLYEYIDKLIATDTTMSRAMLANLSALVPMLRQQRKHWGPVLERKLEQELAFLQLILEGYSIDGAALELGITVRTAYGIRERLLPRLREIAAQRN